jgi:hypothetical protein
MCFEYSVQLGLDDRIDWCAYAGEHFNGNRAGGGRWRQEAALTRQCRETHCPFKQGSSGLNQACALSGSPLAPLERLRSGSCG